jgi:hypothetical protein
MRDPAGSARPVLTVSGAEMTDQPRGERERTRSRPAPPAWLLFAVTSAASILTIVLIVAAQ